MEEILDVVDEEDNFVRKATRKEVREKVLLHRIARVIILDNNGRLLVHKRAIDREMYPSHWDIGVAETVKSGESYESAAIRGLKEEVGITNVSNIQLMHFLLFKIRYLSSKNNEHCKIYKILYDGKLKIQEEEIEDVKFLTNDDIKNLMEKELFHPIGKVVFEKYVELK